MLRDVQPERVSAAGTSPFVLIAVAVVAVAAIAILWSQRRAAPKSPDETR